jgi:hypothetical protein
MKLQMTSCTSLVQKMNALIDMPGTFAATTQAFRPRDASVIARKHRSWDSLRKAWISEEFVEIDHLLNYCRGSYEFCFG